MFNQLKVLTVAYPTQADGLSGIATGVKAFYGKEYPSAASADVERMHQGQPMDLVIAPLFTNDAGEEVLAFAYAPRDER